MSVPRQRVTRSKSQQPIPDPDNQDADSGLAPPIKVSSTTPGPPVPMSLDNTHPSNPFNVDFVIPFDISIPKGQRAEVVGEIKEGYERLLRALEGEGGLKVGTRPAHSSATAKDKKDEKEKKVEEVWVFVGISDEKLTELVERER